MNRCLNTFIVEDIKPLTNSYCGNPRFKLVLLDRDNNRRIEAKTINNGSFAYMLGEWAKNEAFKTMYHYTPKGHITIDYMQHIEE